jgi:hypothetical protein
MGSMLLPKQTQKNLTNSKESCIINLVVFSSSGLELIH